MFKQSILFKDEVDIEHLGMLIENEKYLDLEDQEAEAIRIHRMRDQSNLMRENVVFYRRGMKITKLLDGLDISQFVRKVMETVDVETRIFLGKPLNYS